MDKVAKDHSSNPKLQQRTDSRVSCTAWSKQLRAAAWLRWGVTLAEYTSLPNEAQYRMKIGCDKGPYLTFSKREGEIRILISSDRDDNIR